MCFKKILNRIFGNKEMDFQRPITEIDLIDGMNCHIPTNDFRVIKEAKYNVLGGTIDILSVDKQNNEHRFSINIHHIVDAPKERILCAAIKRKEPRPVPRNPYHEGINDILNIEIGYRHHDIMIRFNNELDKHPDAQGFYTSKGRFVNREEGYLIAEQAGQIINPCPQKGTLYSEDLY